MDRQEYTDRVVSVLRRLTPAERNGVRAEIDAHIEDHMDALLELGYDPELAEERTMAAMGEPEEVGRELEKQYPLGWLILNRIATALLVLCCGAILLSGPSLSRIFENLQARWDPMGTTCVKTAEIQQEIDIRMEIGSDILHIFGVSIAPKNNTTAQVTVYCYWYDKNPLGYVSGSTVTLQDCRGGPAWTGGGAYGTSGLGYCRKHGDVQYGDPYITVVVDRYGERYTAEIPLVWEDGA